MIKKLRVAVDHGNRNMKTCHFIFTSGLNVLDKKPARGEQYLQFEGKYYTLSEQRIPYQRDKTLDFRFFILTLFAIAMELEGKEQIQPEDVVQIQLPVGLPPKHFAELYEKYEEFFLAEGKVLDLNFNGRLYHICIQEVRAFVQDFAAMMTRGQEITVVPKAVGIDIGGFTTDYLLMRKEFLGRKEKLGLERERLLREREEGRRKAQGSAAEEQLREWLAAERLDRRMAECFLEAVRDFEGRRLEASLLGREEILRKMEG